MSSISLPAEILTMMFRCATDLPGVLDTSPSLPGSNDIRAWSNLEASNPHKDAPGFAISMLTKYNLMMVCWSWHSVARQLLYENVRIERTASLVKFAGALRSSYRRAIDTNLPDNRITHAGLSTKLLLLTFNGDDLDFEIGRDVLSQIFRLCSNLRVFVFDAWRGNIPFDHPMRAIPILLSENSRSLRYFSWRSVNKTWPSPLLKIQPLNTLEAISMYHVDLPFQSHTLLTFPKLHTMELHGYATEALRHPSKLDLPALRALRIKSDSEPPLSFYQIHGHRLISLSVLHCRNREFDISVIISLCPALRVVTTAPFAFVSPMQSHPHLGIICLTSDGGDLPDRVVSTRALGRLVPMFIAAHCPSLSHVRLIGKTPSDRMDRIVSGWDWTAVADLIRVLKEKKIQLEDGNGTPFEHDNIIGMQAA